MKVPGRWDIADVPRVALFDHRFRLHLRRTGFRDREEGIGHVHPREEAALALPGVFCVIEGQANQFFAARTRRVALVDQEIVNCEPAFFHDRPHFGEA